jgi:type II secretion system protein J
MKRRGVQSGAFTLIEILVAMALFAMVLMAMYATWTAVLRGARVGADAAAQAQRERMVVRTIEEALTCSRSFLGDVQHYSFVAENGSEAMLSFVAQLPKSFPRSGRFGDLDVRRVAFSVESGSEGQHELVLRQSPILMEFDEDEKNHPLVLAKNVKELLFEFWDTQANDWTDVWTYTNQLPKMIKLTVRMSPPVKQGYSYSSIPVDEVIRIVSLPSAAVPANLQRGTPVGAPPPRQP